MALVLRSIALAAILCASFSQAERVLSSNDVFTTCGDNSQLTATSLNVSITPDNQTISYSISGNNKFSGNATIDIALFVKSEVNEVFRSTLDPCSAGLADFCPSSAGPFTVKFDLNIPQSSLDRIPDEIYIDDTATLDVIEFMLNNTATNETVGCLQAPLKNNASQGPDNATNATTSNGNGSSDSNNTNGSNSTAGSGGDSGASTTYLSWTLLL